MKIVIIGGHLSPALSVIEALPKDAQILYVGRERALEGDKAYSLEYQKITALKIPFANLVTGRLQRTITKHTLASLLKIPAGLFNAFKIIKNFKPDIVIGFGGYLQIPVIISAFILRIPIILHEQTLGAGLANKICSPLASSICISWPQSAIYFPQNKTILTGLPLRRKFNPSPTPPHGTTTILITGGSLGSHAINALLEKIVTKLLQKFIIIHQTGDANEFSDFQRLQNLKQNLPVSLQKKYHLSKFIDPDEIAAIMHKSDLIISRAGINTISELIYLSKPSILIPLPHGQTDEQLTNAKFIESLGIGKVLLQKNLTPEILYSQIEELTAKLDKMGKSAQVARDLIHEDAAQKIVEVINKTISQKK